ncbi:Uncharacterised protein [Legionella quateirensis]|uniref:Uncharacterized protein n=1 Tax=Legionella quateirensis TaxID=45072 RepID=A0A378KPQ9_9GAMM|nr:Uncharacterised protein [Legionella quateirensis]
MYHTPYILNENPIRLSELKGVLCIFLVTDSARNHDDTA